MLQNPELSIIISIYNCQNYIRESLDCILNQSYQNYELILIDDGSTDDTEKILDTYANKKKNITIIHKKNEGQGPSRNMGINLARGKYILILDADDLYEKTFLEKMVNTAKENDTDITICKSIDFRQKPNLQNPNVYSIKDKLCPINKSFYPCDIEKYVFNFSIGWAWDKLYKTDFIKKHNLQFADLRHSEDLVFVYGAYCYNPKIFVIDDILVFHRVGLSQSVSSTRSKNPLLFIDATNILYKIHDKTKSNFKQSLHNWIVEFFYWHLNTINFENKKLVNKNIQKYFKTKQINAYPPEYFHNIELYNKIHTSKDTIIKNIKIKNTTLCKICISKEKFELNILGIKFKMKRKYL